MYSFSPPKKRSLATQTPTKTSLRQKNEAVCPKTSSPVKSANATQVSISSQVTPRSSRSSPKEKARKPPSATTRDVDNQNEGLLYEKLQQREENLAEEKRKLELAKLRLHEDFEELEKMRRALEDEENEINGFNQQMMKDQTELGKQSLYLKKMAADLKRQLTQAENELNGMKKDDRGDDPKLAKRISGQQFKVDKLHELMDLMNNEILTRENDVIQMELAALDHKKRLEEAVKFKQQIDLRRIKALNKKNQLKDISAQRAHKLAQMESSFDSVKKRLDEAHAEKDRLARLAAQCENQESDLQQKKDQLEQRRKELEEKQKIRIQTHKEVKEELELRQRNIAEHPFDPDFDLNALQIEVEKDERSLQTRMSTFEAQNNATMTALNEKKNKLTTDIKEIKDIIQSGRSLEELTGELNEIQAECADSKKIMDERQREIDELKKKLLSENEMNQKNKEIQADQKKILALERELNNLQSRIQTDEDTIEGEEESMRQIRDEIESEKRMIVLKENAANKMLTIYKQQLETSTERYQNLIQQIENCSGNMPAMNSSS